ncbi:6-bladed beta-propeller [Marinilabiliaceae bacterium JC017]|nr:6-bladed beta-propeller [Marinilabiliaceae bacterium JC017]
MKRAISMSAIILSVVMAGCGNRSNPPAEIITVDVNASYPEKELILQDFMDVEYIPLETTNEFITQGFVAAVGKNVILVTNQSTNGDIFLFDKTGKGLRKINRLGHGGEEYSGFFGIVLDESKNEMFVVDYPVRKILVYDLFGSFKRSFDFADTSYYEYIFNYDKDNLICFKSYSPSDETNESCHLLVSKKDGSITREIQLPIGEVQTPVWMKEGVVVQPEFCRSIPSRDGWLLTRTSSDTVYNYLPDGDVSPLIACTPSTQTMDPQVFLYPTVITNRYYFMKTLKKEFDIERRKGFPTTDLVYDNQEKAIFQYSVLNNDYSEEMPVAMKWGFANQEIATCVSLNAFDLIEANEEGHLKGKLKEIASKLDEDSNSVIMLVKHKK